MPPHWQQRPLSSFNVPAASEESLPSEKGAPDAAIHSRSLKILLVDDEELVGIGLRYMLEGLGHRVTEAASGSAAMQYRHSQPEIELLITDYMMPSMTGVALVREARRLSPELPALSISGYAALQSEPPANLPRIGKPSRQAELAIAIAAALDDGNVIQISGGRSSQMDNHDYDRANADTSNRR